MKKRDFLLNRGNVTAIILSAALLFSGCEKDEQDQMTSAPPVQVQTDNDDQKGDYSIVEKSNDSFEVAGEDFLLAMSDMLYLISDREFFSVYKQSDKDAFTFVIGDGLTDPPLEVVCKGDNALKFAKCCKEWLELNPGKCIKVSVNDGNYSADDDCEN